MRSPGKQIKPTSRAPGLLFHQWRTMGKKGRDKTTRYFFGFSVVPISLFSYFASAFADHGN